ncbi:hypothetical protein J6590_012928 [Homalodisca vitripennis]|nr:hypothetical protein J6590_012928 [Homalodisca vitripennis]
MRYGCFMVEQVPHGKSYRLHNDCPAKTYLHILNLGRSLSNCFQHPNNMPTVVLCIFEFIEQFEMVIITSPYLNQITRAAKWIPLTGRVASHFSSLSRIFTGQMTRSGAISLNDRLMGPRVPGINILTVTAGICSNPLAGDCVSVRCGGEREETCRHALTLDGRTAVQGRWLIAGLGAVSNASVTPFFPLCLIDPVGLYALAGYPSENTYKFYDNEKCNL